MSSVPAIVVTTVLLATATLLAGARWLRVAQREHYLTGSCLRFGWRWWSVDWSNGALLAAAVVATGLSWRWPLVALVAAAVIAGGPLGLTLRGRTAPLGRTRRLRTVAGVWLVLQALPIVAGALGGAAVLGAAAGALVVPAVLDLALAIAAPYERRLAERFVRQASERLNRARPTVVAITGSYGKTSTKQHVAHLVQGSRSVVATPASFNNRAGLARAVNENLVPGTEVFVAEMGTYGPGEIAELCRWCPPDISVITAIGPVHLERFGSEDRIVTAKSEILAGASTAVLNVDDDRLAALADRLVTDEPGRPADGHPGSGPTTVLRCSATGRPAEVSVRRTGQQLTVEASGSPLGPAVSVPGGVQASNVACAVAVALQLGVPGPTIVERLARLPDVANRLAAGRSASGVQVLDDTYNANPAGARAALDLLEGLAVTGRRVVVTPGMIELGRRQAEENAVLGALSATVASDLLVVGRTNRRALVRGWSSEDGRRSPRLVATREQAVAWVRHELGEGDAVLYENDLPDHYP